MLRLRFSLRTFLLLLFVASLIGSNLFTAWQLDQARQENVEMRKQLGRLVVTDASKINLVAVPTYEDMMWRWRVYVPKGLPLYVCGSTREITGTGFPANHSASNLPEGEYLLTAAIRRDRHGKWQLTLAHRQGSSSFGISDEDAGWLVDSPGWSTSQAGVSGTEVFDPSAPLELLRIRTMEKLPGGGSTSSSSPTGPGVMLWVDKQ
ncbi:MAG TPA: hypothetical protein VG125_16255 [Pirellulales bacterium]|jgi:hypothetical protein|nr:hypothetical protein [Pirellulales bacterium]